MLRTRTAAGDSCGVHILLPVVLGVAGLLSLAGHVMGQAGEQSGGESGGQSGGQSRGLVLGPPPPAEPEPTQRLDIQSLLTDQRVLGGTDTDPLWTLTPSAGRVILQVPITIEPLDKESAVSQPAVQVRGGRFICWRIVPDDPNEMQRTGRAPRGGGVSVGSSRNLNPEGDPFGEFDWGNQAPPRTAEGQALDRLDAATDPQALPEGAPMMARKLTITPDGRLRWELERAIPSATIQETGTNLYIYRLRSDLLKAKEPAEAERVTRNQGESTYDYQQRLREARGKQMAEMAEFRALRDAVRALPDQFEAPLPARLWAVFEVHESIRELSFTGPEPLPWSIGFEQFQTLRELAKQPVSGQQLQYEDYQKLNRLASLAQDSHPYSQLALVDAVIAAKMIGKAQPQDPLHQMLSKMIQEGDQATRRKILGELVQVVPPDRSTVALLRDSVNLLTPEMKLTTLRNALAGNAQDAEARQRMIDTANGALQDPTGPDPGDVVQALGQALGQQQPDAVTAAVRQLKIDGLPDDRLDALIAGVIRSAGQSSLSRQVLEARLLSPRDPKRTQRTLELLASATTGASAIAPLADGLLTAVFGPARKDAGPKLDLTMAQRIPLDSPSHGMFLLLNSGQPEMRALAWRALPSFDVTGAGGRYQQPQPGQAEQNDVTSMILIAGLGSSQTPPQLVSFLKSLPDRQRAASGLIDVVLGGDSTAGRQAADALLGSDYPLETVLETREDRDRADFVGQLYQLKRGYWPLVAGLLRQPQGQASQLTRWIAERIKAGELPGSAAWAEQAGDESRLLQLATANEPQLAAGAVGALVASAGGDEATAKEIAGTWAQATDRSLAAFTAQWATTRKEVFTRRIDLATGAYRLVLMLPAAPPAGAPGTPGTPGAPADPMQDPDFFTMDPANAAPRHKIVVGVVDLLVQGGQPMISNGIISVTVPEDRLALRVPRLSEVKGFELEELNDIKLELVTDPVDLLPQEDGSWHGTFQIPATGPGELILEPVQID